MGKLLHKEKPGLFGWVGTVPGEHRDAAASEVFVSSDDAFHNAPSAEMAELMQRILLDKYKAEAGFDFTVAEERLYGDVLWTIQPNGNCVGSSGSICVASRLAHDVFAVGDPEEPFGRQVWTADSGVPFVPFSYGVGRHVAGIRGFGDGSTCAGQLEGFRQYGIVPCDADEVLTMGLDDLPQASAAVNRNFGRNFEACKVLLSAAEKRRLKDASREEGMEGVVAAITKRWRPIMQASNWAFRPSGKTTPWGAPLYVRDRWDRWSHQMTTRRAVLVDGLWWFWIGNQWGRENHSGDCGFWIGEETAKPYYDACFAAGIGQIVGAIDPPPVVT